MNIKTIVVLYLFRNDLVRILCLRDRQYPSGGYKFFRMKIITDVGDIMFWELYEVNVDV